MAADLAFRNALRYIENSGINFSVYITPYAAQLSLKNSFSNKYKKGEVLSEDRQQNLEAKLEQLESKLKISDSENSRL
jgi:hypothetical protein